MNEEMAKQIQKMMQIEREKMRSPNSIKAFLLHELANSPPVSGIHEYHEGYMMLTQRCISNKAFNDALDLISNEMLVLFPNKYKRPVEEKVDESEVGFDDDEYAN
jgi:hypothetical protein